MARLGKAIVRWPSTLYPAAGKLLAGVEDRFFRPWPVVAMAWATPVGRCGVPVGRGLVVDRLLKLVLVLGVLLAQGVVLGAQLMLVGGSIGQCLLACLFGALFCRECVVSLSLGSLVQRLLVDGQALLVQRFEVARLCVLARLGVLTQAQVLVDDVGVIGLVQQLATVAGARMVGVGDVAALRAFVDVLRGGIRSSSQQQACSQKKTPDARWSVHGDEHFA